MSTPTAPDLSSITALKARFGARYRWLLLMGGGIVGGLANPFGLVLAATIAGVGRLADKQPTWLLVTIGLGLLALSFALMVTINLGSALWLLAGLATLGRIGLGFILPSLTLGSLRPLHKDLMAQGVSAISFIRMLGGAIGVSLCGIVLEWRLAAHGDSLTNAASSPARLAAFNESFLMLAALCVIAMMAASQLRETPPAHKD